MADELVVDLTGYKDRRGQRVHPGRYRVRVEDAEIDKASTGNMMINLWLTVQGGDFDGATVLDRLVITDRSLFRLVGFMQALGLPTPKKRIRLSTRLFVGRVLEVDVEDGEPYNGTTRSEVRGYLRVRGADVAAAPAGDLPDDLDGLSEFAAKEDTPAPAETPAEESVDDPTAGLTSGDVEDIGEVDLDSLDLG